MPDAAAHDEDACLAEEWALLDDLGRFGQLGIEVEAVKPSE